MIGKRQSRRHARSRDLRGLGRVDVDPAAPEITCESALPSLCLCLAPADRHLTRMARLPCFARHQLVTAFLIQHSHAPQHIHQIAILDSPFSHCYDSLPLPCPPWLSTITRPVPQAPKLVFSRNAAEKRPTGQTASLRRADARSATTPTVKQRKCRLLQLQCVLRLSVPKPQPCCNYVPAELDQPR